MNSPTVNPNHTLSLSQHVLANSLCLFTPVRSCLPSFLLKLKEDYESVRESHTKLEIQVKTSEMELENHAKRTAQLEGEIKGKVFIYILFCQRISRNFKGALSRGFCCFRSILY